MFKPNGLPEDEYLMFDGSPLKYVIINSIKELKIEIDSLRSELTKKTQEPKTTALENLGNLKSGLMLAQNIPNPSDNSTRIDFKIPEGYHQAFLSVYDLNGRELKRITINAEGEGSEILFRKDFGTGVFIYTLHANGLVPISSH